jgi:hypothetical protein
VPEIDHKDAYTASDPASAIALRLRVLGGHDGGFLVTRNGHSIPATSTGDFLLGTAGALTNDDIVVLSTVTKVAPTDNFTVQHVVRETAPSGTLRETPILVEDSFNGANTADVNETIVFA